MDSYILTKVYQNGQVTRRRVELEGLLAGFSHMLTQPKLATIIINMAEDELPVPLAIAPPEVAA